MTETEYSYEDKFIWKRDSEKMRIAVCDDDTAILTATKNILENYCRDGNTEVVNFDNPEKLLSYVRSEKPDVVFMDIELGETNGIETVKKLLDISPDTQIVYYTNYIYYATEVYETEHCWYLLKSDLKRRLPDIIKKVEERLAEKREKLVITKFGSANIIDAEKILYVERANRITLIHTEEEEIQTRETLDEIHDRLNRVRFVRCHKSYIVNLSYVSIYNRLHFQLYNGETIPISRQNIEKVRTAFLDWAGRQR